MGTPLRSAGFHQHRRPLAGAASRDRYEISRGRSQWYGTQSARVDQGKGALVLYDFDRTRVTDRERRYRGVGTLAELCERLDAINRRLKLKSPGCP